MLFLCVCVKFVFGTSDESNGSYAEYVKFNKGVVAKIPESMSAVEGAAFPVSTQSPLRPH